MKNRIQGEEGRRLLGGSFRRRAASSLASGDQLLAASDILSVVSTNEQEVVSGVISLM